MLGCTVSDGRIRVRKPLFGSSEPKKVPRVSLIDWHHMEWPDFMNRVEIERCMMAYLRTNNCLECDRLEDTIFFDADIVSKINHRFIPFEITSDHPDFEIFIDLFEPADVPAVGFTIHKPGTSGVIMRLWDGNNRRDLHILIDQLYNEECNDNSN